jgi:hypothetical protein
MIDISGTIEPKSDQLNADDLISGPQVLQITGVKVAGGDQPVLIDYVGGEGRPYKPCKSMRRALVLAWGKDGEQYVGRSIVVFCDPKVKWAGSAVGGIRISHLSHIKERIRLMLTVTRGKKAPCVIEPYQTAPAVELTSEDLEKWKSEITAAKNMDELSAVAAKIKAKGYAESSDVNDLKQYYQFAVDGLRESEEPNPDDY